jgi:hypothetical protein
MEPRDLEADRAARSQEVDDYLAAVDLDPVRAAYHRGYDAGVRAERARRVADDLLDLLERSEEARRRLARIIEEART